MSWKVFAELVELKAKTASVFPFLLGMTYAWYHYHQLHLNYMILFFISLFLFNMAVDILDNYMDYQRASLEHDYKEKVNIIGREQLSLSLIKKMLILFIGISALIGIYLSIQTSWLVLILGILSFSVGIFYSAGPKPLSSLPVGELASGVTMGFIIPFLCIYLNIYDVISLNGSIIGSILLMSMPAVLAIANLMLANNTCDLEEDLLNHRRTLVAYIGKRGAIILFQLLAYLPFVFVLSGVFLRILPRIELLFFILLPIIFKQTQGFVAEQNKLRTFPLAIKNLALTVSVYSLLFLIGIFI